MNLESLSKLIHKQNYIFSNSHCVMPKDTLTSYKAHQYERSNSIRSQRQPASKIKAKNVDRTSTKTNTSKNRQGSASPSKPLGKVKYTTSKKEHSKVFSVSRKAQSRDGFTMTNSVNIPHLSPISHSEFTRNNSLQFTTHFCESSLGGHPLTDLLQRTQLTLERYELTTQRMASRNKQITRKLAAANRQIAVLERQIRRSKQL